VTDAGQPGRTDGRTDRWTDGRQQWGRTDGRTDERRATVGTNSGQPGRTEIFLKAFRPKIWEVFGGNLFFFFPSVNFQFSHVAQKVVIKRI